MKIQANNNVKICEKVVYDICMIKKNVKKANLNSKPNNPKLRTSLREVCDYLSKSSVRRNLGLT
jgi:hypothetical protein